MVAVNVASCSRTFTTDDAILCHLTGRMLSVGAIHFEDRFCASKKGGIGGGGWVSARDAVHLAAALAGCRKPWSALAGPFLTLLAQTGPGTTPLPL